MTEIIPFLTIRRYWQVFIGKAVSKDTGAVVEFRREPPSHQSSHHAPRDDSQAAVVFEVARSRIRENSGVFRRSRRPPDPPNSHEFGYSRPKCATSKTVAEFRQEPQSHPARRAGMDNEHATTL